MANLYEEDLKHRGGDTVIKLATIDDNLRDVDYLKHILAQSANPSFRIDSYPRLQDGMDALSSEKVDVLLLDLSLPDSKGLKTFIKIHSYAPEIPIVILSGMDDDTIALEAVRNGAQDYLVKGQFDRKLLVRTILYAIERCRLNKKLESVTNELRSTNERLKSLSLIDTLTGALNRRGIQIALSREIQWALRDLTKLLAIVVNLDDFRKINETLGHVVGDVVLKETVRKIKACLRSTDYISRIGGDDFLILLPKTSQEEGTMIAERLRLLISDAPIELTSGRELKVTASIGVVTANPEAPSVDELLEHARSILSASKKTGKNKVTAHHGDHEGNPGTSSGFSDIYDVLKNGRHFRAVKQPIFDLSNDKLIGYEFLSRTTIPGFENPEVFFRACLEANILTLVDHRCLKVCIEASHSLPADLHRHLNLFPSTMIDIPVEHLLSAFPKDMNGNTYCIEISEQQIIGSPSYLLQAVDALRREGILIAIDDVGFGRTCLESLVMLEPNIIKIDKNCINGIADNIIQAKQLKRILDIGKVLEAEVVAEGIERPEDLKVLKKMDVRYGQGYLLGRPG
ncbi:MAG: hypothetical protein A3G33_02365 [Omnitrophica bacterium RIFCSPLOWO2_12_FULL_44_17]|uniref:Diguanylate cyclase n=1 Tax=Candidatus Danuiimicrobium aquiferis TaxID=1801832 RepID=A0A1G1L170_9BACT|nr:MAG: hypothetical protein A3B72_01945 [Omnitrophica bacterium RIFCSPHIGHO2_02_FULL_45_28]OGW90351.1 MAG: hypothetical protein A3E74_01415 [Omnitrophica bacterium RIFCSPHIGHO2_12_FULL_44_12]OGW98884.1 MAG: hypothetical protein A3G33_02365 [Omnitrophica bacterium RIFCSPLOWO2_12_FULL_44_17]OGX02010.1 MAG: hypothetical protein A3J12_11360 [Omnitrophica bacterium RIFCSPLOWO2_02_FULL_44_11]